MRNSLKYIISIILILFQFKVYAQEEFIFESNTLEFLNSSNLIKAKNGVKINDNNGIEITADESTYNKINKFLEIENNINFIDKVNKIKLESEKITFDKKSNEIKSNSITKIIFDNIYTFEGKNITYLKNEMIVFSNEKTLIKDNFDNLLETDGFLYDLLKKNLKTKKLKFFDKNKNEYKSENSIINLKNKKIAAKDIQIYFGKGELGDNARIKGSSLIKENKTSIISNAIFTTCKINDNCPPWVLKSKTITHDENKKTINYDNSWLVLYDIPVFYFPKFFHPDPTVKRQSGFLTPSFASSSNNGNSILIPYYNVISENKDFTFTPRIYTNKDILVQNEYRQAENNSDHITDFSIKKLDRSSKSHFFSNTKFFLENDKSFSELEINLEQTSNDTYLKSDDIKTKTRKQNNQSLLSSFIKFNSNDENTNISSEIIVYEDLGKTKKSDKFQYVLPNFKISQNISSRFNLPGSLNYKISGSGQMKETNVTEKYLINDLIYKSNLIFPFKGFVSDYELNFKNSLKEGKNSTNYSNETKSDNYAELIFNSTLPLMKKSNSYVSNFIPKFSFRYSPNKNENLASLERKINTNNIFSSNRLGINDSLEGGQSLTAGIQYEVQNKELHKILNMNLAQIFRDKNDHKLPKSSKMQNKKSDIVGNLNLTPNEIFKIDYNFSADNNLQTMNFSEVKTELNINNFITSFEFLEENNDIGSDSYLSSNLKYLFSKNNSILYNTRRNRKTNLTEYYNLIYEYKNDCLVAAIEYNKNYYQDRDLKPSEDIFFSITITPFTSINSPNLK